MAWQIIALDDLGASHKNTERKGKALEYEMTIC